MRLSVKTIARGTFRNLHIAALLMTALLAVSCITWSDYPVYQKGKAASGETASREDQYELPGPVPDDEDFARVRAYDFRTIDRYALEVPKSKTRSVRKLAKYLDQGAGNDLERVRAAFRWIAANIDYDLKAYYSDNIGDTSAETTLRRRKSVCDGYSRLFAALLNEMGVKTVQVTGFSKTYGADGGPEPNHAWNAVLINGKWWLADPTWGAGYVISEGGAEAYERAFQEFYFLPEPEYLVFSHFPEDRSWQLLQTPLPWEEFAARVRPTPWMFAMGYSPAILPASTQWVRASGSWSFSIPAHDDLILKAGLTRLHTGGQEDGSGRKQITGTTSLETGTCVQKKDDSWLVQVLFPEKGYYNLSVFAGREREENHYYFQQLFRYGVNAESGSGTAFPTFYGSDRRGVFVHGPLQNPLKAGQSYRFKVESDFLSKVRISENRSQENTIVKPVTLTRNGSVFEGEFTPQHPGGRVIVWISREDSPKTSSSFMHYQVTE